MAKKEFGLGTAGNLGFGCIIVYFLVLFAIGIHGHYTRNSETGEGMPDQVIRLKVPRKNGDTLTVITTVPFRFLRPKR